MGAAKSIELGIPRDFDKSFVVYKEVGQYFPCPWHYHPEYEMVLVLKSTGRRMVGDNIGYFKEGDLVLMGSSLPHVWLNDPVYLEGKSKQLAEAIVIHFNDEFLENFIGIPEMEEFKTFLMMTSRGMSFYGKTKERINNLIKKMVGMNGLQRISSLLLIFDILSNSQEYRLLASPGYPQSITPDATDRLGKITGYIVRNFHRDISLPEVANVANMGVTTFCNFFKEQYKTTFVEYLNSVKIGHACKLLSETNQNVVEVAYQCGFNSLANFNRQFKKHKGMTPSKFRKTLVIPDSVDSNRDFSLYE